MFHDIDATCAEANNVSLAWTLLVYMFYFCDLVHILLSSD
jgi:hypothetical protein